MDSDYKPDNEQEQELEPLPEKIRKAAVAGLFYPSAPGELTKTLAHLYNEVDKIPLVGIPSALIVPHAGYPYSGRTAAKAYKLLQGESYETVVVIAPSHSVFFKGSSVFDGDGYQTPLGVVEIDKELSEQLAGIHPAVYLSGQGHASGSTRGEHALELQLPFLQVVLGSFKLVAIIMGDQEEDSIRALGEVLASGLKGKKALLIASTDLSHFHSEKDARKLDMAVQRAVEQYDSEKLIETLEDGKGEACGGGIVAAVMMASRRLGGGTVKFLEYTTSGETTGEFDEVVGYLSAAIVPDQKKINRDPTMGERRAYKKPEFVLTDDLKQILKQTAIDAVEAKVQGKKYKIVQSGSLDVKRGLFVTITIDGELRGCIGQIKGEVPLYEAVSQMAVAAAFEDPRFSELTKAEFERAEIEVSVLSQLKRTREFGALEIGKHGLMVKLDFNSGLLLPQVAIENNWDMRTFLEQTCLKAGLPMNCYKEERTEVYSFTADIF